MSMPTGRSEKRTPVELAVLLSSLNERPFKERAFTENVSSRGLRAITKRMWQPGTRLLVSFDGRSFLDRRASSIVNGWRTRGLLWGLHCWRGCSNRTIDSLKLLFTFVC